MNGIAKDNSAVRLRLLPVLPVMVTFHCECSNPPQELPAPHTTLMSDPPQYVHRCPACEKDITLSHAAGAVMFQRIGEAMDDINKPKLVVAREMPK